MRRRRWGLMGFVVLVVAVIVVGAVAGSRGDGTATRTQIPGTDVDIEVPKTFEVAGLDQGLVCDSATCGDAALRIWWGPLTTVFDPTEFANRAVESARTGGVNGVPAESSYSEIDGIPSARAEAVAPHEAGESESIIVYQLARNHRWIWIWISGTTANRRTIETLDRVARGVRFTDEISPRDEMWTVRSGSEFALVASHPYAAIYSREARPMDDEKVIEVSFGCARTDLTKASPDDVLDFVRDAARGLEIDLESITGVDVGDERAYAVTGKKSAPNGDRLAWVAILPRPTNILFVSASHPYTQGQEPIGGYQDFARQLRPPVDEPGVTCREPISPAVTVSVPTR